MGDGGGGVRQRESYQIIHGGGKTYDPCRAKRRAAAWPFRRFILTLGKKVILIKENKILIGTRM